MSEEQPSTSRKRRKEPQQVETMDTAEANAEPSTSAAAAAKKTAPADDDDDAMERQMENAAGLEEFLQQSKTVMMDYEKHMFMDMIDTDGLVVSAK